MKKPLIVVVCLLFGWVQAHALIVSYSDGVTNTSNLTGNSWVYLPSPSYPASTPSVMFRDIIRDYGGSPNGASGASGDTVSGSNIFGPSGYDITKLSWVIGVDGGADSAAALTLYTGAGTETVSPGVGSEGKEDYRYDTIGGTAATNLTFYYDDGGGAVEWVSGYITQFITTVTDIAADNATGIGYVTITETTVAGQDFFDEIMAQSGGTGSMTYYADSFQAVDLSNPGSFSSAGSFTVVPEPSTWALLMGLGGLAFAWMRRRRVCA